MTKAVGQYDGEGIPERIFTIRGEKVILDADLARIYGVATKALNQAVKRNADRFPGDFMFQLTEQEVAGLIFPARVSGLGSMRSQSVTASAKRNVRFRPNAFTEHGAIMAATVLNSPRAVQMSAFVVRAFVRMRAALTDTRALASKLAALEREVKARLDTHDASIVDVLRRIMDLIDPPELPETPKQKIGFSLKDRRASYRASRKPRS